MKALTLQFMILYVIFPLIALLTGIAAYQMNRRIKLLANRKVLLTMFLSALVLGVPGLLGFLDYDFMPYGYIALGIVYLILGMYALLFVEHILSSSDQQKGYRYEIVILVVQLIMGAALFSLLFNICNEFQYGLWACTCLLPYLFGSLYKQTYYSFLDIPLEVYKVWTYNPDKTINPYYFDDSHEPIWIDVCKKLDDHIPNRMGARFSNDQIFGEWFQHVIEDNNEKKPEDSIMYHDSDQPFGWIFYVKPSFFLPKRYIDPNMTISQNRLKPSNIITARRVMEVS